MVAQPSRTDGVIQRKKGRVTEFHGVKTAVSTLPVVAGAIARASICVASAVAECYTAFVHCRALSRSYRAKFTS